MPSVEIERKDFFVLEQDDVLVAKINPGKTFLRLEASLNIDRHWRPLELGRSRGHHAVRRAALAGAGTVPPLPVLLRGPSE